MDSLWLVAPIWLALVILSVKLGTRAIKRNRKEAREMRAWRNHVKRYQQGK